MKNVIVSEKSWNKTLAKELSELGFETILISKREDFTFEKLQAINPKYVFIPHWSYIIPKNIFANFECIVFHMTDLPFGRGGSPLQNLIDNGITETKISALKVVQELDAGDIYLKKPLSLFGDAEEIYLRASKIIFEMVKEIIKNEPKPAVQTGEAVFFKRRKPNESNIEKLESLEKVFDYIRMLDADGYPKAFLETDNFRFEFSRASLKSNSLISDVKITLKNKKDE